VHTPFWVQCVDLGGNDNGNVAEFRVWCGNDPRHVSFRGDAYWMWQFSDSPYRNHGRNFSWAQAFHDGLIGPHATILHSGHDRFCVHPQHEDYAHVARMWELANSGVSVPEGF
jgi:hypothetical protein